MTEKLTMALIDGDMLLYRACLAVEREDIFDEYNHVLSSDYREAKKTYLDMRRELLEQAGLHAFQEYFSSDKNWRKDVASSYKDGRKGVRKPLCLKRLKDELVEAPTSIIFKGYEADDVLGITAANDDATIILSHDKDFYGVPCKFRRWSAKDGLGKLELINKAQARYFHMVQTLAGDRVDGYFGCPKMGMVTAKKLLDSLVPIPGQLEEEDFPDVWDAIVSAYEKQGLDEGDALVTGQLSYICREVEDMIDPIWTPERYSNG